MPVLYIASDRPGSGRTALAASVAALIQTEGAGARVAKPAYLPDARVRDTAASPLDPDIEAYRRLGFAVSPSPLPVTPQELVGGLPERLRASVSALRQALNPRETLVVEGLPGVEPSTAGVRASGELADLLDAKVVVMVGFASGLSADLLRPARQLFQQRLLGVVINRVRRYQSHWARTHLVPSLEAIGVPVLGIIPEERRLLGIRVQDIATELQGEFVLGEAQADILVEHLMVGANVLDDSTLYFQQRDSKAVLVRGDRPDIQMGALATSTACLVLTGGTGPVQYIRHEAEQEGIPIVRVSQRTLEAAEVLDAALARTQFDHPLKLARFQELLRRSGAWEPLLRGLRG